MVLVPGETNSAPVDIMVLASFSYPKYAIILCQQSSRGIDMLRLPYRFFLTCGRGQLLQCVN